MSTGIEWADETWNPVTGCTPVSEGCSNCYAKRMAHRLAGQFGYPAEHPFEVTVHPDRFLQPTRWKKPRRVFVCSMGDLFHPSVPADAVAYLFEIMAMCKQHTFMVLTKRPERMADVLFGQAGDWFLGGGDYYENIWLGVTAENQAAANTRLPPLLNAWMGTTFVSCEPLLEPVDISPWLGYGSDKLDWVICGGETGPNYRPMDPAWARSLRDQCQWPDIPFFFKHMSGRKETPPDLRIREWPKP